MLGKEQEDQELDVFELLEFLSNSTRRRILELLAEEDLYSFQISRILDISPRIIAKYLAELESLGIVSMIERESDKGPTRKYAQLNQAFSLIIDVGQNTFNVRYFPTEEIPSETIEEKTKEQEEFKLQITKELIDIRDNVKNKAEEIHKLDQKRKKYVQDINNEFTRFSYIIENTIKDYYDRAIIRTIFKILINKPENKVSLTELANRMRLWRGELRKRLDFLVDQIEFIKSEEDNRGEVWYSI